MPLSNVHHVYWQSDRDGSKLNNLMQKFYSHNQNLYLASYIFNTITYFADTFKQVEISKFTFQSEAK